MEDMDREPDVVKDNIPGSEIKDNPQPPQEEPMEEDEEDHFSEPRAPINGSEKENKDTTLDDKDMVEEELSTDSNNLAPFNISEDSNNKTNLDIDATSMNTDLESEKSGDKNMEGVAESDKFEEKKVETVSESDNSEDKEMEIVAADIPMSENIPTSNDSLKDSDILKDSMGNLESGNDFKEKIMLNENNSTDAIEPVEHVNDSKIPEIFTKNPETKDVSSESSEIVEDMPEIVDDSLETLEDSQEITEKSQEISDGSQEVTNESNLKTNDCVKSAISIPESMESSDIPESLESGDTIDASENTEVPKASGKSPTLTNIAENSSETQEIDMCDNSDAQESKKDTNSTSEIVMDSPSTSEPMKGVAVLEKLDDLPEKSETIINHPLIAKTKIRRISKQSFAIQSKNSPSDDESEFPGFEETSTEDNLSSYLSIEKEKYGEADYTNLEAKWWQVFETDKKRRKKVKDEPSEDLSIWQGSSASSPSLSSVASSPRNRPASTKPRQLPTDAIFRLPFDMGFKREIVYRSTVDGGSNSRRMADIYYFTPEGKKLRSSREVAEFLDHIKSSLTPDHFTFMKEPVGIEDPTLEIIREAKKKDSTILAKPKRTPKTPTEKPPKPIKQTVVKPPIKLPIKVPAKLPMKSKTLKVRTMTVPVRSEVKSATDKSDSSTASPMPPLWSHPISSPAFRQQQEEVQYDGSTSKMLTPCCIQCPNAPGLIPTLQCSVCVCLYHPECVGLSHVDSNKLHGYVCKNCRQEKKEAKSSNSAAGQKNLASLPPPLHPITTLAQSGDNSTLQPMTQSIVTLPRLQRIPRPGDTGPMRTQSPSPTPQFSRMIRLPESSNVSGSGSGKFIYAMTPWRPPAHAPPQPPMSPTPRPSSEQISSQTLALMNGKKYIVIPRNNMVAVASITSEGTEGNDHRLQCAVPPPVTLMGQPPVQMLPAAPPPLLPQGTIVVGQSGGVAAGGMYLMSPSSESNEANHPHYLLLNPTAASPSVPVSASMVALNPNSQPKVAEGGGAEHGRGPMSPERSHVKRPPPQGKYNFTDELSARYNALLNVFRYLTVQELLRSARVCRMWRDVVDNRSLWTAVHMKNSTVSDWMGCGSSLLRHGTSHLDLRKMLLPNYEEQLQVMWPEFCLALQGVHNTLRRLELCRCPGNILVSAAETCPYLRILTATALRCKDLDLKPLSKLSELEGLRLKSTGGMSIDTLQPLKNLTNLKHLSLTTVRLLRGADVAAVLREMPFLELLELGDCSGMLSEAVQVSQALGSLKRLQKLRLEKLIAENKRDKEFVHEIIRALPSLHSLTHLELINIEASTGCELSLGECKSLKKLLIIPSYILYGSRSCQLLLSGVLRLKQLELLVWTVTNEVVKITLDLAKGKPGSPLSKKSDGSLGDCIAVLKPSPFLPNSDMSIVPSAKSPSSLSYDEFDFIPVTKLQTLLSSALPKTKVIVHKVSFQATWRQAIADWDI